MGWHICETSEVATKVPVAPESRIAVGEIVGGTKAVGFNEKVFSNLILSAVPPRQVGSQKQLVVLPPIMSSKVAASLWAGWRVLQVLLAWAQAPCDQQ